MTESALETTPVPAPAVDVPSDHTGVAVNDPIGVDPLPTGDFAPAGELVDPEPEPELTDEQKAQDAWLIAEAEWRTRFDAGWEHERVDFHGDYLACHTPSPAALTAVSLGSGKYIADQTRADVVGKFIQLHLAPESYGQFLTRMMNPLEKAYGGNAFGDLVAALSEATTEQIAAQADNS